jgi:K+-sensing histidine kinase KdpD
MEMHIVRMERYVEAMNSIEKLDNFPINKQIIEMDALIKFLEDGASRIADQSGKSFDSCRSADSTKLFIDKDLVMQVSENLVANGVRYASSHIKVHYSVRNGIFSITVTDDGSGFSEEVVRKAVLPFYRGEAPEANENKGLGLYICKILCEKHQGFLQVANSTRGGGKVTASFFCRIDK